MGKGRRGAVFRLVGVGWYVALCIVGGIVGGLWLDGVFHTKVLFTFLGLGIGIILAFWGLYRMLAAVLTDNSNNNGKEA